MASKADLQAVGILHAKALRRDVRGLVWLDQSEQVAIRSERWQGLHLESGGLALGPREGATSEQKHKMAP